ncbi:stage V sporulation protein D (sporulation-specific penicillin-binding protein) [Gemmiger formicilis]|uniref:Stage V sporulation protein D (Sporulation-specific penicillin-binding protein) n=2 Tax=Gemmiger formicilis TaxID=745368 RepID=A0A1T4WZD2_9FIRM|nr:stage V sporulation protein D (sporulation-specific penicillin-binding protein) [Gemmiger formicilis]
MTEQRPNHSPRHRPRASKRIKYWTLFCMIAFILACYGVLVYQLYVWQVRDAESYRAEAVTQQLKDTTLPAVRGSIYSANGKLLAKSSTVWNIVADPSSILESGATEDQIRTAAEHIAELLDDGTTADTVYKALTASNKDTGEPYQYRVVKKSVEKPVADAILAYADSYRLKDGAAVDTSLQTEEKEDKEDKKDGESKTSKATRILYLTSEQAASRTYPYGEFLASVLGFCNEDGSGAYGLEKYYDETLAGTPGRSVAETDAYGDPLASGQADVHEAIDGSNLNLTIDENVQSIVEEYLTEAMSTFTVHGRGSAIVMNVKTGAILAMASLEQFDPNDPKTITDPKMNEILAKTEIDAEDIDWLESRLGEKAVKDIIADGIISHEKTTNEKGEEVSSEATQLQGMMREAQWKNKNITELYMPGSVFKLITASAGLDSGVMSAEQTFYCNGSLTVNEGSELWEHTYRCANGEVHGLLDMAGALNHSCNLWFIQAAETLKPQIFYDYIQAFGFTQPTGIDLPNETRWTSVYNAEQMAEVDTNLYTAAFGQNESITPMQMATAVAAIANGGYLVTPYVVDSISDKDGNIISQTETNIRRQVISEEVSRQLLSMMENNVYGAGDYHSCANAYVAGYRIGGKSGTAERTDRHLRGDGDYYKMMSFAAVLPIDDPEIEVFVLLDDPRWVKDYASQVVAPVVGNIISEIAPYLGIEQDADYNPTGTVTVQTCLDYTWTNAQVTLNRLGLKHKLIGPSSGNIVYQYPVGGSVVPAGSTIYLYTATDQNSMTTTPDVVGKTGTFAEQMLKAANLNVQFAGDSSGKVVAQDVEAGTSAAYGTIITLTMDSGEDTTNDAPTVTEEIDPANEEG